MSDKTILCKCLVCLKESADGVLVSMRIYLHYHKNQQEFLDVEEINISHQKQNVEDVYQQEDLYQDLYQQKNIYQQDRELDIDNIYNDFNEEDNEYYSDYDIKEYDDYMANKDDDGITNEDDDSIANEDDNSIANEDDNNSDNEDDNKSKEDIDNENNENIMQIDNITPNKEIIEGLKLLYLKTLYNFTESAYDDIMKVFIIKNLSLYKVKKYLKEITGLIPVFYDMCENSCIYYTGQYESY